MIIEVNTVSTNASHEGPPKQQVVEWQQVFPTKITVLLLGI